MNRFHPNHLLYSVVSKWIYDSRVFFRFPEHSIWVMEQTNAIIAAFSLMIFTAFLSRRESWLRAILATGVLAFSFAYWSEVVDPGCYAWATMFGILLLFSWLYRFSWPIFVQSSIAGIAVLFHQMYLIVIPFYFLFLPREQRKPFFLGTLLVVGLPYLIIAYLYHGPALHDMFFWFFAPAGAGPQSGILHHSWWSTAWGANIHAFLITLMSIWCTSLPQNRFLSLIVCAACSLLFFGILVKAFLRKEYFLFSWICSMSIFQFFWCAGTTRFRLLWMPAWIYLLVKELPLSRRKEGAMFLCVLAMALWNWNHSIRPNSNFWNSPNLVRAVWVGEKLRSNDFFLFSGIGSASIINVYVAYFAPNIQTRSLSGYFFSNPEAGLSPFSTVFKNVRQQGGRIILEASLWSPEVQKNLEETGKLPRGFLQQWLSMFKVGKQWTGPNAYTLLEVS